MMKTILVAILFPLFASPLHAQDQASAARAAAGCGPDQVNFDVKSDKKHHPAPKPEPGKALVYVFQDVKEGDALNFGSPTTKVGLDGAWVGANHGNSYFFFSSDPGNHHVCAAWQSSLPEYAKLASAADLAVEVGKSYYLLVRVKDRPDHLPDVKMEHIDPAEAQLLIASSSLSTSHVKK